MGIIRLVSLRSCSHRRLTSPPSLWPGRELRKYHYRCLLSSPGQEQLGIFSRMDRSSHRRRKLHILRFTASGKAQSFRCSSSPQKVCDLSGTPFGDHGAPLHRLFQTVTWSCLQDFLMTAYSVFKVHISGSPRLMI